MTGIDKRYIISFLVGTTAGLIALFLCLALVIIYFATFNIFSLLGGIIMFAALVYIIIAMKKHKAKIDLETENENKFKK